MYRRKKRTRVAEKARTPEEKCALKHCRNRRVYQKGRYKKKDGTITVYEKRLPYCWKCKTRMLKTRHPVTYAFNVLRKSARKRKIPFTITSEEFAEFCQRTGYIEKKGNEEGALTVGRIDHNKGYHIWNIQAEEFTENSVKGHTVPGEETKQNASAPGDWNYDFDGPDKKEPALAEEPF